MGVKGKGMEQEEVAVEAVAVREDAGDNELDRPALQAEGIMSIASPVC